MTNIRGSWPSCRDPRFVRFAARMMSSNSVACMPRSCASSHVAIAASVSPAASLASARRTMTFLKRPGSEGHAWMPSASVARSMALWWSPSFRAH